MVRRFSTPRALLDPKVFQPRIFSPQLLRLAPEPIAPAAGPTGSKGRQGEQGDLGLCPPGLAAGFGYGSVRFGAKPSRGLSPERQTGAVPKFTGARLLPICSKARSGWCVWVRSRWKGSICFLRHT